MSNERGKNMKKQAVDCKWYFNYIYLQMELFQNHTLCECVVSSLKGKHNHFTIHTKPSTIMNLGDRDGGHDSLASPN